MELNLQGIQDSVVRENFRRVKEEVESFPFLKGNWRFIDLEFKGPVVNYKFRHGFNFIPLDVIPTSTRGVGTVTWHFDSFSRDHIVLSVTNACRVRAFVGSYSEG